MHSRIVESSKDIKIIIIRLIRLFKHIIAGVYFSAPEYSIQKTIKESRDTLLKRSLKKIWLRTGFDHDLNWHILHVFLLKDNLIISI